VTNEELVAQIQSGARDKIPELWNQVEKFVSQQAGKRTRQLDGFGGITQEDLYQAGFLALIAAVDSFDPAAGSSFINWLAKALKTAFAEAAGYRSQRRDMLNFAVELDAPSSETEDLALADSIADPAATQAFEEAETRIWREQLHTVMESALQAIPQDYYDVLRCRFYQQHTRIRIAEREGCSVTKIQLRERRALQAMRNLQSLQQFVELRTSYYSGNGLQAFRHTGSRVEQLVIHREELIDPLLCGHSAVLDKAQGVHREHWK